MSEKSQSPEASGLDWSITGGHYEPIVSPSTEAELKAVKDEADRIRDEAAKINSMTKYMIKEGSGYVDTRVRDRYVSAQIVSIAAEFCNPEIWAQRPELAKDIHRKVAAVAMDLDEVHDDWLARIVAQAVEAGLGEPPIAKAAKRIVDLGGFTESDRLRSSAFIGQLYLNERATAQADAPTAEVG